MGRNARWLALSYLLWGIGEGLWIYIQSLYIVELGATPEQSGLVIGASSLIKVITYLPAGWLADRFGPRQVMLPAWIIGTTGVIGIALAPDWHWLLLWFVVYGMSGAGVPLSAAYLSRVVKEEAAERPQQTFGRVLTMLSAGYSTGLIFAPSVGGWLSDRLGLRPVFILSVFWFVLSALAATRTRPMPPLKRSADTPGYGTLARQRRLVAVMLAVALTFAFVALVTPTGAVPQTFLSKERDLDAGTIGLFGSLNAVGSVLAGLWLGRHSRPFQAFLAVLALTWAGTGLLLLSPHPVGLAAAYLMCGGFNVSRQFIESALSPMAREDQQGVLMALIESVCALGFAVGIATGGRLYESAGPRWPFVLTLAALPPAAGLCWLILSPGVRLRVTSRAWRG
jgi:DHA1 family multidrug resistance protein-like MFS transporter